MNTNFIINSGKSAWKKPIADTYRISSDTVKKVSAIWPRKKRNTARPHTYYIKIGGTHQHTNTHDGEMMEKWEVCTKNVSNGEGGEYVKIS